MNHSSSIAKPLGKSSMPNLNGVKLDQSAMIKEKKSELFSNEKMVYSILAQEAKPLLTEWVRTQYLERLIKNIFLNTTIIKHNYTLFASALLRSDMMVVLNMSYVSRVKKRAISAKIDKTTKALKDSLGSDTKSKEKALKEFSRLYSKSQKKYSKLNISKESIKEILLDLVGMQLVKFRDRTGTRETRDAYFIDSSSWQTWSEGQMTLKSKITQSPFADYQIQEVLYYGLDEFLLNSRIHVLNVMENKLIHLTSLYTSEQKKTIGRMFTNDTDLSKVFSREFIAVRDDLLKDLSGIVSSAKIPLVENKMKPLFIVPFNEDIEPLLYNIYSEDTATYNDK